MSQFLVKRVLNITNFIARQMSEPYNQQEGRGKDGEPNYKLESSGRGLGAQPQINSFFQTILLIHPIAVGPI